MSDNSIEDKESRKQNNGEMAMPTSKYALQRWSEIILVFLVKLHSGQYKIEYSHRQNGRRELNTYLCTKCLFFG